MRRSLKVEAHRLRLGHLLRGKPYPLSAQSGALHTAEGQVVVGIAHRNLSVLNTQSLAISILIGRASSAWSLSEHGETRPGQCLWPEIVIRHRAPRQSVSGGVGELLTPGDSGG
jgi:hypothetical protein